MGDIYKKGSNIFFSTGRCNKITIHGDRVKDLTIDDGDFGVINLPHHLLSVVRIDGCRVRIVSENTDVKDNEFERKFSKISIEDHVFDDNIL